MAQDARGVGQRVGDEERHKVAEILADHHAHGRLAQEEFEDRLGAALTAQTTAELGRLLADLPLRHAVEPSQPSQPKPRPLADELGPLARRAAPTVVALGGVGVIAAITDAVAPYNGGVVFVFAFATGVVGLLGGRATAWIAGRRRTNDERNSGEGD